MAAWEDVELTRNSMGRKVDSLTLKRIIRNHLPTSLHRIVLEETNLKGNAVITEALLELLFSRCPRIESITLLRCDMKKVGRMNRALLLPEAYCLVFLKAWSLGKSKLGLIGGPASFKPEAWSYLYLKAGLK